MQKNHPIARRLYRRDACSTAACYVRWLAEGLTLYADLHGKNAAVDWVMAYWHMCASRHREHAA